ncbi:MAG: SIS domain-containing protein [Candidatus Gastranaerophilales bacterium]|nr:SIS domain-containing protein [Candidatus Gastranaerophilales bacterium]
MKNFIKNYVKKSADTKSLIMANDSIISEIEKIASTIIKAYKEGKKVLTAGNGGSAGDAQHLAAELVSKFLLERPALSAIALTTNTSILTSVGNDYDHELVFARQISAHANKGDVFFAISTSGESKNILKAVEEAKRLDVTVIGLTGEKPASIDNMCDYLIKVPSTETPIIQEAHLMIEHIICAIIEKQMYSS